MDWQVERASSKGRRIVALKNGVVAISSPMAFDLVTREHLDGDQPAAVRLTPQYFEEIPRYLFGR